MVVKTGSCYCNHFHPPYKLTTNHLSCIEFTHILGQGIIVLGQESKEITANIVVHDQIQIFHILKGVVQLGEPLLGAVQENVPLLLVARLLRPFGHFQFVQHFHGIDLLRLTTLNQRHLTKGSLANDFEWLKVGALQLELGDLVDQGTCKVGKLVGRRCFVDTFGGCIPGRR